MTVRKGCGCSAKREPLDVVVGLIAGVLWGATAASGGLLLWVFPGGILLTGVMMVCAAPVFGVLGYWKGDGFSRWIRDQWFD
jgi:hypothetical protein